MTNGKIQRIEKGNIVVATILSILAFSFVSMSMAISIAVGALIAALNFSLLRILMAGLLFGVGNKTFLALLLFLKFMILFGVLAVAIIYFDLHLLGILIGLSSLVISIFGVFFKTLWNMDLRGFN